MFKKFSLREDVKNETQVKTSVQRGIRATLTEQYPALEPIMDDLMPKKTPFIQLKCAEHINLLSVNSEILFFQHYDGPYMPTLKLLHKYPEILPKLQVDRGAIKFVLQGANIMCRGLTSKGAMMDNVPEGRVVALMAEGKEHALAIGLTKMSSEDIRKINKGVGVDTMHYLRDDLWKSLVPIEA